MVEHRGMRHDTDIGAWVRRWSLRRQWCAGTFSAGGPFDMPFIFQVDEDAYVRRLRALFRRCSEESTEEEAHDWLSIRCFELPNDKFYLVRDATDWWCQLDFDR